MRRVSGKISLATRRIWGDPEDEDELSPITSSGLKFNGSEFTTSIEEGDHSESAYNDDVKPRAKLIDSGQTLENDGELPIASKKSKSLLNEKLTLLSTDSDIPDEILYNPLTKATLPEQTDRDFKKDSDSSGHDSISSSVVCPPLSYHNASMKDFAPCNGTMLNRDHNKAPQDLHKSINISYQCSKINIEDQRISELTTKAENRFFASENSNPQENITSTDGPCFDEHINDSIFENAVEDCFLIPVAIESKDLILKNTEPSSNEVPSKPNKLESCDEKISNNLENEISQVSTLLEIENQLTSKPSSEFHIQLCSKEIDDGNDTVHVAEPIIFNENCVNQDYMSSSVTDLSDSLAVENKQNINEASDKKTSSNLDLSDEILCLDQALPLRSHLEPKNNTRDSVSLDEDKSSRCTEITEHTSAEFANPITSNSILNVAKDASDENNLAGLNIQDNQMRSQIIGDSNEEVDEGYTLITSHNYLYDKARASDTKFEENHDCLRKSSNKYSDGTKNIGDKNDYNYSEVHGDINAHRTDLTNDLKIESVAPIDQKSGKDNKKLPLEGAELSETGTVKATRNRKTWLRYVKSFEKRHEEGDSSSIRLSSGRESSSQSERVDRGETIAFTPKIPETPMKKKYAPSHSDSITPEKRRRSFRKKLKEKISDTLHKLKD